MTVESEEQNESASLDEDNSVSDENDHLAADTLSSEAHNGNEEKKRSLMFKERKGDLDIGLSVKTPGGFTINFYARCVGAGLIIAIIALQILVKFLN